MALKRAKMVMGTPELRLARGDTGIHLPYPGPHVERTVLVLLQCSRPKGDHLHHFPCPKLMRETPPRRPCLPSPDCIPPRPHLSA